MIPGNQNDYNPFSRTRAASLGVNWGSGTTGDTGANYGASSGSSGGASWGGSAATQHALRRLHARQFHQRHVVAGNPISSRWATT